jgi:hypothetical protein
MECNPIRYGILELISNHKTEHTKPNSTQFLHGFNEYNLNTNPGTST